MSHVAISLGPLDGQVDCVTAYLGMAMFIAIYIFSERKFPGKNTRPRWANKSVPDQFHNQSRPRVQATHHPSGDGPLLGSQG